MQYTKVESLWRYPVKSLMGESLDSLSIDTRGVVGDRIYAIKDSNGKLGSGKNSRRFRRIDGLFSLSAKATDNGVSITFPDGSTLPGNEPSINSLLSQTLGLKVTLNKEGEVAYFDDGAIHILTTASLSLLHGKLPHSGIESRRFRPNIVIASHFREQDLLGKIINMGTVSLEVTHKTKRCRMVTIRQPGLESRPEILKTVSEDFGLDFGVYAKVLSVGSVSVGDKVEIAQI